MIGRAGIGLSGDAAHASSNTLKLDDDIQLQFGTDIDYWHVYNNSGTQYQFRSTDVDGAGADGTIWDVQDGTNDVRFVGGIGVDNQAAPTSGLHLDGDLDFQSASSITTTSGNLNLNPSGDVTVAAVLKINAANLQIGNNRVAVNNINFTSMYSTENTGGTYPFSGTGGNAVIEPRSGLSFLVMDGTGGGVGDIAFEVETANLVAIIGSGARQAVVATGGTLRAPNLITGGAGNIAGADLSIAAGLGTGTGDVGTVGFSLPIVATAGDNLQTTATRLTLDMVASADALTMQAAQALTIGTDAGDLTLSPTTDVVIPDGSSSALALALGSGSDSRIYYDGTDTFWDLHAVGTGDLMIALGANFPSPDPGVVHIWKTTAGVATGHASSLLVLESGGADIALTLLGAKVRAKSIIFGEPSAQTRGQIKYFGSTDSPADTLQFSTASVARIQISAGAFAFQEAMIVSTTAGDLTLNPTDDVQMGADVFIEHDTNADITASTTKSQGQGALTTEINEISTVAGDGDTVTLPAAAAGRQITIINNGVSTLQMFPALGDDLGAGVDVSEELEPNEVIDFVAYDATNWHVEATTEIIHAEMFDTDNGDAYVINAEDDDHMYHTNGMAAGDLAEWTFDAGGAGTSFPVASIADSPGSGGSQAQITTTGSHLLAVGDIISLTNMSAGTNAGTHIVVGPVAATTFEITSTNSTNATGTMDQAAVLIAGADAAGQYLVTWAASASIAGNNEIFDFSVHVGATHQTSTNARHKFGSAGDVGSVSGVSIIKIAGGDKVSFQVANTDSAADFTIRDLTIVLVRL